MEMGNGVGKLYELLVRDVKEESSKEVWLEHAHPVFSCVKVSLHKVNI